MKILMLGTFPIQIPIHGGQRRCRALFDSLEKAGHQAKYIGIYNRTRYPNHEVGSSDVSISADLAEKIEKETPLEDLLLAAHFPNDLENFSRLIEAVKQFRPEIIQIEQPYLWPVIKEMKARGLLNGCRLIYSSHNIEFEMKATIYKTQLNPVKVNELTEQVRKIEVDLSRSADQIIVVSESDKVKILQMGTQAPILVIPNGSDPKPVTSKDLLKWMKVFTKEGIRASAFFVTSGHIPNMMGFINLLGTNLGLIPADTRIILAGSGAQPIVEILERNFPGTNLARLKIIPNLNDTDLAALIKLSHVILLPIMEGGGSNLKTAEALLSGRPILATHYAFRSFEKYINRPAIHFADDPTEFKEKLLKILTQPFQIDETQLAEELTWNSLGNKYVQGLVETIP